MRRVVALAIVAGFLLAGPAQAQDQEQEKKKSYRFTAFAINMNSGPRAGMVDIVLERLTTDREREEMIATFVEGGQNMLLKWLQKVKPRVGYIRTPNSLGYDLQYAWRIVNSDGSSRVIIGTDRPINFWEASRQPRTIDYPFTIIEMRLDAQGNGEGRMAAGTKISRSKDGKTVELENYGISPVALNEIKLQK
ncbi:MAG: hypothetical protein R6V57_05610 [Vicinamibacterales bacterium]